MRNAEYWWWRGIPGLDEPQSGRGLDTSLRAETLPGVRQLPEAPSASGIARHQQSAIRIFCHLSFVIYTAIGYWQPASLHSFSKNEYRYFAQNHRIESPRID